MNGTIPLLPNTPSWRDTQLKYGDNFRCRWEDDIKINCKETGCEDVDRIHMTGKSVQRGAPVNAVINVRVA
jgi:hypothetical protein